MQTVLIELIFTNFLLLIFLLHLLKKDVFLSSIDALTQTSKHMLSKIFVFIVKIDTFNLHGELKFNKTLF